MEKSIVVPWDFSQKAEASFQHALILSKIMKQNIVLFHVLKNDKEKEESQTKLEADANRLESLFGVKPKFTCRKGDIYTSINDFASEIGSPIVVMPLHKSKRAVKVVIGSSIPFYLVQEPPKSQQITDIVVPIDHYEENRVQLNWVIFLANIFNSNINIIKPFINSNARNRLMKKNIFFAKQLMDNKKIVYGIRTAKREVKFSQAISNFTKEIEADLIFMMTYNFKDFMSIAEKEGTTTPILCLNPKSVKIVPDKY